MWSLDEVIKKANRHVWISMSVAAVASAISGIALFHAGDYFCIGCLAKDIRDNGHSRKESEEES